MQSGHSKANRSCGFWSWSTDWVPSQERGPVKTWLASWHNLDEKVDIFAQPSMLCGIYAHKLQKVNWFVRLFLGCGLLWHICCGKSLKDLQVMCLPRGNMKHRPFGVVCWFDECFTSHLPWGFLRQEQLDTGYSHPIECAFAVECYTGYPCCNVGCLHWHPRHVAHGLPKEVKTWFGGAKDRRLQVQTTGCWRDMWHHHRRCFPRVGMNRYDDSYDFNVVSPKHTKTMILQLSWIYSGNKIYANGDCKRYPVCGFGCFWKPVAYHIYMFAACWVNEGVCPDCKMQRVRKPWVLQRFVGLRTLNLSSWNSLILRR